jgi:hypothetical protein
MSIYLTQKEIQDLFFYHSDGYLIRKIKRGPCKNKNRAGRITNQGYSQISINYKCYVEHQLVWLYHHGEWPSNNIDHINRIKSDNRIENLRLCPNGQSDNLQNLSVSKNNKSGKTGVTWHKRKRKWMSQIIVSRKNIFLGYYDDLEEAIEARKQGELKYFKFVN